MDVLADIHNRTRRSPPIDWVASVPPRHLKRAATWSEDNWRRASARLTRVSTLVGDTVITRMRTQGSRTSFNVEAGLGNDVALPSGECILPMVSPILQSPPKSPLSSVAVLPQLTEEEAPESPTLRNPIPPSTSTASVSTVVSDGAASSSESHAQLGAGKKRLKDIVRNVMRVRQSAAGMTLSMPNRQRTVSSSAFTAGTDGGRSMSEFSTLANVRVSRVASLVPQLKSLVPVHFIQPHSALVRHMQFSPNGEYLATCSWDRTCAVFRVKDFSAPPRVLAHPQGFVGQVAWSPKGDLLLTKMVRGMKLWTSEVRLFGVPN